MTKDGRNLNDDNEPRRARRSWKETSVGVSERSAWGGQGIGRDERLRAVVEATLGNQRIRPVSPCGPFASRRERSFAGTLPVALFELPSTAVVPATARRLRREAPDRWQASSVGTTGGRQDARSEEATSTALTAAPFPPFQVGDEGAAVRRDLIFLCSRNALTSIVNLTLPRKLPELALLRAARCDQFEAAPASSP